MTVVSKAKHMNARISPKKVAPVMDVIRGKSLEEAKVTLAFDRTKAAKLLLKVVKSAEANAVNNASKKAETLFVEEVWVSEGRMIRTGRAGSRGRGMPIIKRNSHIYVNLGERK